MPQLVGADGGDDDGAGGSGQKKGRLAGEGAVEVGA